MDLSSKENAMLHQYTTINTYYVLSIINIIKEGNKAIFCHLAFEKRNRSGPDILHRVTFSGQDTYSGFDYQHMENKRRVKRWTNENFDPEELEEAHTSKVSTMMEVECPNEDFNEVSVVGASYEDFNEAPLVKASYEDFGPEELEEAHTSKARNLKFELIRKDATESSLSESEEFIIDIENVKEISEPTIKYCIYKVPRDLCKINEEAYTPQVVSIGPLHHLKEEYLIEMEKQKLGYVQKFIRRTDVDRLQEFKSYIKDHERQIRACYAENLNFPSSKFVRMILRDVVFIFELFLRNDQAKTRSEFDILLDTPIRKAAIKLDLQLLENQLPYFILKELFSKLGDSAKPSGGEQFSDPFLILALRFFYDSDQGHLRDSTYDLQHFTDLRRHFLLKEFSPPDNIRDRRIRDLRCATKLHGSGVKFEKSVEDRSSLEIHCEYMKRPLQMIPCIKLQELVLEIPRFEVYDGTECLIRNVMAFEQLHYPWKTHVCNYIHLMDFLIDTEKDVDLLVEKGIIFHCLGDNAAIANMFNKLCLQVTPSYSCYYDIGEKLKAHYGKSWNHAKATLKNVYFRNLWIGTGTVAAALLLLLTLAQTVFSILQVVL